MFVKEKGKKRVYIFFFLKNYCNDDAVYLIQSNLSPVAPFPLGKQTHINTASFKHYLPKGLERQRERETERDRERQRQKEKERERQREHIY